MFDIVNEMIRVRKEPEQCVNDLVQFIKDMSQVVDDMNQPIHDIMSRMNDPVTRVLDVSRKLDAMGGLRVAHGRYMAVD